jgi:gluconolactonase
MYATPPEINTEIFAKLPERLHYRGEPNDWVKTTRPGKRIHSFLEGPAFDREGNLYCTDIPYGRIFRVSPQGEWALACEYDGEPNGLKIHRDGRIFIADHRHGIMVMDPASGRVEPFCGHADLQRFKGCNDLFFASNGDLYFTDPGRSSLSDPTGRVFRVPAATGAPELLLDNVPYPNGVTLNREETPSGASPPTQRRRARWPDCSSSCRAALPDLMVWRLTTTATWRWFTRNMAPSGCSILLASRCCGFGPAPAAP